MISYRAKEGERLDQIVYDYYGSLSLFESVLEKNTHLMDKMHLTASDIVYLEESVTEEVATSEENLKSLW